MLSARFLSFASLLLLPFAGLSQTGSVVVGAGYRYPLPISAAPGQILNLFVQGVGASLTQRVTAAQLPLPATLAGISVQLTQSLAPRSVSVPLVAVTLASAHYTVVTVQIPFELAPNCQPLIQVCPSATPISNTAQLVVSENGNPGAAVDLNPVADQVHIANLCDIDLTASLGCAPTPSITHANGTLISSSSPAKPGEEIVIYAVGLGTTNPAVPTGQAAPSPAPVTQTLQEVNFEYGPNAGPSRGLPEYLTECYTPPTCPNTPVFSGLTPGYAGSYQVNFVIPTPPPGTPPCGFQIASNLTLTLVGSVSFDGAGICVMPLADATALRSPAAGASSPD